MSDPAATLPDMPLRSTLNGVPIVSTALSDEEWLAAKATAKADRQALLMCGCELPGRPWTSRRGLRYFRHLPDATAACTAHLAESPEHLEAKAQIAAAVTAAGWEALVEEPGPGWEADVLAVGPTSRIALEVQWSQQTPDRYRERQAAYRDAGVHGVWFARHPVQVPPSRDLPVFLLAREAAKDGGTPLYSVTIQGRTLTLAEAVTSLLKGRVRFCSRVAKRGQGRLRHVEAYEHACWKCPAEMTVWRVQEVEVEGECGLSADGGLGTSELWSSEKPEADAEIHQAVMGLCRSSPLPPLAQLKHRRTMPVPEGYLAFCCPSCGIVQGDFELQIEIMRRAYDGPDASTVLRVPGRDAVAERLHWCFGSEGNYCPR